MTLNPVTYSTRSLSLLMLAAFAGIAVWLFVPWGGHGSGSSDGGGNASAALPPSLQVDGTVQVESTNNIVTRLVVPLAAHGSEGVDLSGATKLRAETAMADTATAAVPATYSIAWNDGNGDKILDPGEHAVMTVTLPTPSSVHPANPLRLVLTTSNGAALAIEDVLGR